MTVIIVSIIVAGIVVSALLCYCACALSSRINREQEELDAEMDRWEQASEEDCYE